MLLGEATRMPVVVSGVVEKRSSPAEQLEIPTTCLPSVQSDSRPALTFQAEADHLFEQTKSEMLALTDDSLSKGVRGAYFRSESDTLDDRQLRILIDADAELNKRITAYASDVPARPTDQWQKAGELSDDMLHRLQAHFEESYDTTGKSSTYQQGVRVAQELESRRVPPETLTISDKLWKFSQTDSTQLGTRDNPIPKEINREHIKEAQFAIKVLIDAARHHAGTEGELKNAIISDPRIQGNAYKPSQGFQFSKHLEDAYHIKIGPRDRLCFMVNTIDGVPTVHNLAIFDSHKDKALEGWHTKGRKASQGRN